LSWDIAARWRNQRGNQPTSSKRAPRPEDENATADSATGLPPSATSRSKRSTSKRNLAPERSEGDTEQQLPLYRERRRVIQQQYRQRLRERGVALEQSVERLRGEFKRLEQHRDRLCAEVSTRTTPWNVVAEYFRLFRYGFELPEPHSTVAAVDSPDFSKQKQFL
jgi:superfamily I DNA and/or RNA helicase